MATSLHRPGVPGRRPCPHPLLRIVSAVRACQHDEPGSGEPARISRTGARAHPGCGTL